jgi:hypothetical protein
MVRYVAKKQEKKRASPLSSLPLSASPRQYLFWIVEPRIDYIESLRDAFYLTFE